MISDTLHLHAAKILFQESVAESPEESLHPVSAQGRSSTADAADHEYWALVHQVDAGRAAPDTSGCTQGQDQEQRTRCCPCSSGTEILHKPEKQVERIQSPLAVTDLGLT